MSWPTRPGRTFDFHRGAPWRAAAALLVVVGLLAACGGRNRAERQPVFHQVTAPVAFEMMHDFPQLPVLDLRPVEEFHGPTGHIQGAFNAPREFLPRMLDRIAYLKESTFLVYCRRDECGPEVLDYLREQGFENAMLIHGGIEAWRAAGFGTVGAGDADHDHAPKDGEEEGGKLF